MLINCNLMLSPWFSTSKSSIYLAYKVFDDVNLIAGGGVCKLLFRMVKKNTEKEKLARN